ncbi:LysO family transporter [Thermophagus sp. OGC60D27]|uniref:LysO family transporter n=1 Tax=Thermophagus sp. OGC60D27 TaxID=3458415 RepID=UPI0040383311
MIPFIVVALFFLGLLIGYLFFRNRNKFRKFLDSGVNWTIYLLLFLLGISVGRKEEILNNFSKIGLDAIVLALGAILGSILLAFVVYKWFFENREG